MFAVDERNSGLVSGDAPPSFAQMRKNFRTRSDLKQDSTKEEHG
jgi:hypothetical protein